MFSFLLGLAGAELRVTARRAMTTAMLFAIGLALMMIAVGGVMFSIFLALAERNDPVSAALITTAIALGLGAVFVLAAYVRLKRRRRRAYGAFGGLPFGLPPRAGGPLGAVPPGAVPPVLPPAGPLLSGRTVAGIAAGAALIGLIIGRRI